MTKWSRFRKAGLLVLVTIGFWLITAVPYRILIGGAPLEISAWAAALCTVAGAIVFYLTDGVSQRTPEVKVVVVLLATFIRMGTVLGGGAVLYYQMAPFRENGLGIVGGGAVVAHQLTMIHENGMAFIGWMIVFYLVTLAVETGILASAASQRQQTTNNGN